MTATNREKAQNRRPLSVGVIRSEIDLRRAWTMRRPPDLFELRLDALAGALDQLERQIAKLRAPLIMTARHPSEGGIARLTEGQRRKMLLRFLPFARYIDLEVRSLGRMRSVINAARAANIGTICSFHDFTKTPAADVLREALRNAAGADIFKLATTVNSEADIERLVAFFDEASRTRAVAAMGMGKLGRKSRRLLARRGSVLNYASLGERNELGQLTLAELRRTLSGA